MRILGLDLGERRIGVAAADDAALIAVPITTLVINGDPVDAVVNLVQAERADELVVGLPLSLSGGIGRQAQRVIEQTERIEARLTIPVHTWDERLTTAEAGHRAKTAGVRKRTRRRHEVGPVSRDAMAATIILQAYLDSRRK